MKILKLYISLALLAAASFDSAAERLNFYGRDAATIGVYVADIKTGRVIESENAGKAMIPASTMKLVTSASALKLLSPGFRYNTSVELQGDVDDGKLCGNLVIKASGDPTIESAFFADRNGFIDEIIKELGNKGITSISGEIIVDEEAFTDTGQIPQWVVEDTGWDYGAGFYGFNYNNNTFRLYTEDQHTVPEVPYIDVMVEKTAGSTDIARGINSDLYIVSGRNVEKSNFYVTTTMNSPAMAFITNLQKKMQAAGIAVEEKYVDAVPAATPLFSYKSPANDEMLRSMMHRSDNLMAEAILRAFAPGASRDTAIKKEIALWKGKGIETSFLKIADGSGLARVNRVTPRFLGDILVAMAKDNMSAIYVDLFPKVGRDGTVKTFLKGTRLAGKLALKSGSMNGVHCYAGYKLDSKGNPTHAVVILVNNFFCSRDALRKEMARFLLAVFK